ncbi:alkene reductase [Sphingobium phenoxybenzoativorans]|uniref:Alkene reductase n=1 Tax=Sphingobium phenoxybenzoativorans TaxID=1592790 RepID=A0A975K484_9SPHN|nr:alkene reductase [Sphingobium phenoxybenzoativorans]QUT04521.1 alkene reductase [Sphingobium phenoxybenzoativorans]
MTDAEASNPLFSPYQLGEIVLPNRVIMAPMTRWRSGPGFVPLASTVEYYAQRASAGLIITEGSPISEQGRGYPDAPGIYTRDQIKGWKAVTDAVHQKDGRIFIQIWHVGRISYVARLHDLPPPVAPSAIPAPNQQMKIGGQMVRPAEPRALELTEIPGIVDDFRRAAAHALEAGFDGVELHGANGYLLDAFAKTGMNARTDAYGGSIANRSRLMLEVTEAVATEVGRMRTGIRIAPVNPTNDSSTDDAQELFEYIAAKLNDLQIAYLHVVEGTSMGDRNTPPFDYSRLRSLFKGTYIGSNGYDPELARHAIETGNADLISFARSFVANPDLVERFKRGLPLAKLDPETLLGGSDAGYSDYPTLT